MQDLLDGLALQSGKDDAGPSMGVYALSEDEAGIVSYEDEQENVTLYYNFIVIRGENGCFMAEACGPVTPDMDEDARICMDSDYSEVLGSLTPDPVAAEE